jgi:hypothetical protein
LVARRPGSEAGAPPCAVVPTAAIDIVSLGEPMVELNQTDQGDARLYLQGFGGDTSSFAVAARQGVSVAYVSAVRRGGGIRQWLDQPFVFSYGSIACVGSSIGSCTTSALRRALPV